MESLIAVVLRPRKKPHDPIAPNNFAGNGAFVGFLHDLIAREGPYTEQMIVDAESIGNGTLYIIDSWLPRPESGQEWVVKDEDLIGQFDVKSWMVPINATLTIDCFPSSAFFNSKTTWQNL